MTLVPSYPGPVRSVWFRTRTEGWTIGRYPAGGAESPQWTPVEEPGTDFSGACSYEPAPAAAPGWYFCGPAALLDGVEGGAIAFALRAIHPEAPPPGPPATTPDLVLAAGDFSLGLPVDTLPVPSETEFSLFVVRLGPGQGWLNLATGAAASAADWSALLVQPVTLMIRGDRGPGVAGARLGAVEVYRDPARELGLDVQARYENGALSAAWPASAFAAAYEVEVKDDQGVARLERTIPAAEFSPPVVLQSDAFQPAEGSTYRVTVRLVGLPGAAAPVRIVALGRPVPVAAPVSHGVRVYWPAVPGAVAYEIALAQPDGTPLRRPAAPQPASEIVLTAADGLRSDAACLVVVRAVADGSYGAWSESLAVRLPSAAEILAALRARLGPGGAEATVTFDAATLPAGAAGDPDRVRESLGVLAAAEGDPALAVVLSAGVVLTDERLTLEGQATVFGLPENQVRAVFTVSAGGQLELTLTIAPPVAWVFSDYFPDLGGTAWDGLVVRTPRHWVTTYAHEENGIFFRLEPGLNFWGELAISTPLARVAIDDVSASVQWIAFGGAVRRESGGTRLAFVGAGAVGPFDCAPGGFPGFTVTAGTLRIDGAPGAAPAGRTDRLRIEGRRAFGGAERDCTVDLPNRYRSAGAAVVQLPAGAGLTVATLVDAALGAGVLAVPAILGALPVPLDSSLGYEFPFGSASPAQALLTLGLGDWTFGGSLSLRGSTLELGVTKSHYQGDWQTAYAIRVRGTLALGELRIAAEALVPSEGPWTFTLSAEVPLTLPALLNFAGLGAADAFAAFPAVLRPFGEVGVSEIMLTGRPGATGLERIRFVVAQLNPWVIFPGFELRDGQLAVQVTLQPARARAVLTGAVRLGTGPNPATFPVTLSLPPAAGESWEIELAEGQRALLPGIRDLAALFGAATPALPDGMSELDGLVAERFLLRFELEPAPRLLQLDLSLVQAGEWEVVSPRKLVLGGFYGHFGFHRNASGLVPTVDVGGRVTVCGLALDAHFRRESPAEWLLAVAHTDEPFADGLSRLDAWLDPAAAKAYLGSAPALNGAATFAGVYFAFDAATGGLRRASLAFEMGTPWDVIPGKLAIAQLYCQLRTTFPIGTGTWTGRIGGTLAFGGAEVLLTAEKAAATAPWRFAGELVAPVPIDLTGAADGLVTGEGGFTLPADARHPGGLPAAITIESAELLAVPETGEFRFAGLATFTDWNIPLGATTLVIREIGGEIAIAEAGAPLRVRLTGALAFAGVEARLFLQLGRSAAVDTVLAGVVAAEQLSRLDLGGATDAVAGAATWSGVTLPESFLPPGFTSAGFLLNVSGGTLLIFGQAARFGKAALLIQRQPGSASAAAKYGFALCLNVEGGFRFADILPESAPAALRTAFATLDAVIALERASLSVSSFDFDGDINPYAEIGQLAGMTERFDSALPIPTVPGASQIDRGLNVDGRLKFEGALWESLGFIIEKNRADAGVDVHANFDPAAPDRTLFRAKLGGFTILGTLRLEDAVMVYRPQGDPKLTLVCAGAVIVPSWGATSGGGAGTATPVRFDFTGNLVVFADRAQTAFVIHSDDFIDRPLGIPGITVKQLGLRVAYALAPERRLTRFALEGRVALGTGTNAIEVAGAILFVREGPRVVVVTLEKSFGLGAFFLQCIGRSAYDSPALPDLTLLSGTFYYAQAAVPAAGTEPAYAAGFHLSTDIDIFGSRFLLSAEVSEGDGIAGTAAKREPIDLGFIKLTGPTGGTTGPQATVRMLNGDKKFELGFGFELFGLHFRDGSLAYTRAAEGGKARYSGGLTFDGKAAGLGANLAIKVEWTQEEGFRIVEFPAVPNLAAAAQARQLVRLFETLGKTQPCQVLGALGIGPDFIKGELRTNLKMRNGTPPAEGSTGAWSVAIEAEVWYEVYIEVAGHRTVLNQDAPAISIPALELAVPTLDGLLKFLFDAVAGAVEKIVDGILQNPTALAALVKALAVQRLSQQALSALICRRVPSPELKAEMQRRSGTPEPEDPPAEEDIAAAEAALEEMATVGFADAVALAGQVAIFVGKAKAFFDSLWNALCDLFGYETDDAKHARERREYAEELRREAERKIEARLAIAHLAAVWQGEGRVRMDWTRVEGAGVFYVVEVWNDRTPRLPLSAQDNWLLLDNVNIAPGTKVDLKVCAQVLRPVWFIRESYYQGAQVSFPLELPDLRPVALTAEQVGTELVVRWRSGAPVDTFVATVTSADGTPVTVPAPAALDGYFCVVVSGSQLRTGIEYTATVTAHRTPFGAQSAPAVRIALVPLAAPTEVGLKYLSGVHRILAGWSPAAGAAGQVVQAYTDIFSPLVTRSVAAGAEAIELEAAAFTSPAVIRVRVAAQAVDGTSLVWSTPAEIVLGEITAPVITVVEVAGGGIRAQWEAVPGATEYEAEVSVGETALQPQPAGTISAAPVGAGTWVQALFSGRGLPFGQVVVVRARGRAARVTGPWSVFTPAASLAIPSLAPRESRAEVTPDGFLVTWTPSPITGSRRFEVRLQDAAGTPLPTPAKVEITVSERSSRADVTGEGILTDTDYLFAVRVAGEDAASAWIACAPVRRSIVTLPAPVIRSVGLAQLQNGWASFEVAWDVVPQNAGFEFQLRAVADETVVMAGRAEPDCTALTITVLTEPRLLQSRVWVRTCAGPGLFRPSEWSTHPQILAALVNFGPEILDQVNNPPGWTGGNQGDLWQSFTPGVSGFLTRVEAMIYYTGQDYRGWQTDRGEFMVYEGEGSGGSLLARGTYAFAPLLNIIPDGGRWEPLVLSTPILIAAGKKYTIRLTCASWRWAFGYDRGRNEDSDRPQKNYLFKTYVRPRQA